jgi:hypothetical protein
MTDAPIVHLAPAWLDRGDSIVSVNLVQGSSEGRRGEEELWMRRLDHNRFELCCIPFFAYDLALGDQLTAEADATGKLWLRGVVQRSGRSTFRVRPSEIAGPNRLEELIQELAHLQCLTELWHPTNVLAIDAESEAHARSIFSLLYDSDQLNFEMARSSRAEEFAVHLAPVWRAQANALIHADIAEHGGRRRWEQLWAKRLPGNRFQLCCIPFFVYDLALGDEVATSPAPEDMLAHVVREVTRRSGHLTFRVWFGKSAQATARDEVLAEIKRLGCEAEWYSRNLLAINAPTDKGPYLAEYLSSHEQAGNWEYETGRSE